MTIRDTVIGIVLGSSYIPIIPLLQGGGGVGVPSKMGASKCYAGMKRTQCRGCTRTQTQGLQHGEFRVLLVKGLGLAGLSSMYTRALRSLNPKHVDPAS